MLYNPKNVNKIFNYSSEAIYLLVLLFSFEHSKMSTKCLILK